MTWEETKLPWIPPSPNVPTPSTALAYVGNALFEGAANVSEGRGTTKPFELVGAAFADGRLAARLRDRDRAARGRKVLKERRSPRERGRMGTSV